MFLPNTSLDEQEPENELESELIAAGNRATAHSWCRSFFDFSDPERRKCLLPPEASSVASKPHYCWISAKGDLSALKKHLASSFHSKAMKHFHSLVSKSIEESAAAQQTISFIQYKQQKNKLSFSRGTACYPLLHNVE